MAVNCVKKVAIYILVVGQLVLSNRRVHRSDIFQEQNAPQLKIESKF
jgi:hypothetical protein